MKKIILFDGLLSDFVINNQSKTDVSVSVLISNTKTV